MAIEISVVKSPEQVQLSKVCQVFTEGGGSIGRGEGNTWVIDDPERFISSTHTQIIYDSGQYYLSDVSTNGTFLNGASEPIGNGNRVLLKNGDNFSLGDYEFSVNIPSAGADAYADTSNDPFAAAEFSEHGQQNAFADPVSNYPLGVYADPFSDTGAVHHVSGIADMVSTKDSEETDPLAMLDNVGRQEVHNPFMDKPEVYSQVDNAEPMQHAVAWPNVIPDDWDQDIDDLQSDDVVQTKPPPAKVELKTPIPGLLEKLQASENRREALEIENEQLLSEIMHLKQKLKNQKQPPVQSSLSTRRTQVDQTLLDAMGLGDWELSAAKKAEISETVGKLVRESIAGLMQSLGFRKKIKEEFRINVTTIQPVENNPLKFSANIEDALENMFIKENKAYMKPLEAVREGFRGISEHQIAVLAGIQAAFRGMIERLDPEALEKRFEKYRKTGVIKVGQKGKNWESYKEFHQDLVNNIDNSFQFLFGYDFVQAYEEQLQRLLMVRKSKSRK